MFIGLDENLWRYFLGYFLIFLLIFGLFCIPSLHHGSLILLILLQFHQKYIHIFIIINLIFF